MVLLNFHPHMLLKGSFARITLINKLSRIHVGIVTYDILTLCSSSYSLSQNGWDTLGSPCPLNVGVQDLVTELR